MAGGSGSETIHIKGVSQAPFAEFARALCRKGMRPGL